MTTSTTSPTTGAQAPAGWRLLDILVAAVLAVAFGAVFQGWNVLWEATTFALAPLRGAVYGVWMLPAIVVPLVVRRPGAALFGEGLAAAVSMLFGAQWGLMTVVYGLVQGAGAELVFAFGGYRRWSLPMAMAAGGAAGLGGALLDLGAYYPDWATDWQILYAALVVISSVIVAGLGGWLLVRALAATGVLSDFEAGRDQRRV